jgi:hypothetical protein
MAKRGVFEGKEWGVRWQREVSLRAKRSVFDGKKRCLEAAGVPFLIAKKGRFQVCCA